MLFLWNCEEIKMFSAIESKSEPRNKSNEWQETDWRHEFLISSSVERTERGGTERDQLCRGGVSYIELENMLDGLSSSFLWYETRVSCMDGSPKIHLLCELSSTAKKPRSKERRRTAHCKHLSTRTHCIRCRNIWQASAFNGNIWQNS